MELNWLEDFLVMSDLRNFNRAAEKRNLTQPAFSRRIKALEEWMGVELFDRSTHRVELTTAGEAFVKSAEEILRRVTSARTEIREIADIESTTLRFSATHALSLSFFPTWIRSFDSNAFMNNLQLLSDTKSGCETALQQGKVQFMICHTANDIPFQVDKDRFLSKKIGTDVLTPVSANDSDGKPAFSLPGNEKEPIPFLSYSPQSALGWAIQKSPKGGSSKAWLKTTMTAHLATVLRAMVCEGHGIAWLPLSLIQDDLKTGALIRAGSTEWDCPIDIKLFRPKARQSKHAELFWDAVE